MNPSPAMLRELAERVEAAAGPDRELELAIWRATDLEAGSKTPLPWLYGYTSSLDAAMTLVPEGWRLNGVGEEPEQDNPMRPGPFSAVLMKRPGFGRGTAIALDCASYALALTAACLKARALSEERGDG